MRILHTSDWHIGHTLGRNKRYDEHAAFLAWLAETLEAEAVDALVVAGDVFDNGSPTNRAQELYYDFLFRVAKSAKDAKSRCRQVVVVAGNHDSPTFLNAPRALLRALDIHVVGSAEEDAAAEVIALRGAGNIGGAPEVLVCAVPYLRDRDIRESAAGESVEEKDKNYLEGIRAHYAAVLAAAEEKAAALGNAALPIIATGHLFAAGGGVTADDGVRELHVGSLARVPAEAFPERFCYVALGHLHAPQVVDGDGTRRYSGAPLAMGFGEAGREKSVAIIDIDDRAGVNVRTLAVPVFQRLERISGNWEELDARLTGLVAAGENIWLDVEYTGEELLPDLHARVVALTAGSGAVPLKIGNRRLANLALAQNSATETLDDLDPAAVFDRCLDAQGIAESERGELRSAYAEIIHTLYERDEHAH